jgi:hypothetical protein
MGPARARATGVVLAALVVGCSSSDASGPADAGQDTTVLDAKTDGIGAEADVVDVDLDTAETPNACTSAGGVCDDCVTCPPGSAYESDSLAHPCPITPGPGCFHRCCFPVTDGGDDAASDAPG